MRHKVKEYTLILNVDDCVKVVLTDDPNYYLTMLRLRKNKVSVLFYTKGNYRGKIHKFGTKHFLECVKSSDDFITFGLNVMYSK